MKVHFFPTKEKLLAKARILKVLPEPYRDIQLYADFLQHTLALRKQLKSVTKSLFDYKIPYKWKHPATLLITKDGTTSIVSKHQKGMRLLHSWGIVPAISPEERKIKEGSRLNGNIREGYLLPMEK